jgi:putative membrane protein
MLKKIITRQNTALFIALLFHTCGVIGILAGPYKQWFINNTPLTLAIMAVLLVITQTAKNKWFYLFVAAAYITGLLVELTGVNTGWLFGHYSYGTVLGAKLYGVPWLIGVNWFTIVYCAGCSTYMFSNWLQKKLMGDEVQLSTTMQVFSFMADAAMLTTFFDWVLEPVAVKLGFWQWQNNTIPLYNYVCWFAVSALLLLLMRLLPFSKHNQFAVHLLIIQLLFFLILQTFL